MTSKELVLKTFLFDLFKVGFKAPGSGREGRFDVLESRDWANVIALTPDGKVVMVRQFRFGTQEVTLEFPAGSVDPGEEPIEAARRELLEETGGAAPASLLEIGRCRPNPAFLTNTCHHFVARGVRLGSTRALDELEEVKVELVPVEAVDRLIREGAINHSLSIAAWHFFKLAG